MDVQTHKAFCGIKERQVLTRIIKRKKTYNTWETLIYAAK